MKNKITPKQSLAFDLRARCIFLRKKISELFLEFGYVLKKIRDEKLYLQMGEGGFETFYQFLADPEINLNPNTASAYIRVYEFYVEKLGFKKEKLLGIPLNRLNQIKNFLEDKTKNEVEEWIEKARTLGREDFVKEMESKKIVKEKGVKIVKCKKCGKYQFYYKIDAICQCPNTDAIFALPVDVNEYVAKKQEAERKKA